VCKLLISGRTEFWRGTTDMQGHGAMKDAQQILRHASIKTTAEIYMQEIQASVRSAINSRTRAIFSQRTSHLRQLENPVSHQRKPNSPKPRPVSRRLAINHAIRSIWSSRTAPSRRYGCINPDDSGATGVTVRRERRWTHAGATPARKLVRSIR
jgi:hypothetical protein